MSGEKIFRFSLFGSIPNSNSEFKKNIKEESQRQLMIENNNKEEPLQIFQKKEEKNEKLQEKDKDEEQAQDFEQLNETSIFDELLENFNKYKEDNENKKHIIISFFTRIEPLLLIKKLVIEQKEDVVKYIFFHFAFEDKEVYNQTFFKIVETNSIGLLQYFIKNNLVELEDLRDDDGNSCLLLAVIYGHIIISRVLISSHSELIYAKNNHGFDCLTISVYNSDTLMFSLILQNHFEPINNLNELVIIAIRNENISILEILIQKSNKWSDLLLHHVASQSSLDVFNLIAGLKFMPLIDMNLDVKQEASYLVHKDENGEIPLHWSVMRGDHTVVKRLVELMLKSGLSVDYKAKNGITPFHLACLKQDKELVHVLFDSGANVNELDNEGNSVCHMIGSIGDKEWLAYLVNNYNLNCFLKNNKGNTALVLAILSSREQVVEYFLSFTPNINWKNKLGQTPLHSAVFTQNTKILSMVLDKHPDIKIEDITGLTAYHYALMDNNHEIISIINEYIENSNKLN